MDHYLGNPSPSGPDMNSRGTLSAQTFAWPRDDTTRTQVLEELQSRPISNEKDRKEVLEILRRMRDQELDQPVGGIASSSRSGGDDDDGDAEDDDLGRALQGLELAEGIEWADLTPAQQHAFQKAAAEGQLSSLVDVFDPWWRRGRGTVVPVGGGGSEEAVACRPPPIASPLPPLRTLTSKEPSELVSYGLVDILWSYARCQRWCNGEASTDPSVSLCQCRCHHDRWDASCGVRMQVHTRCCLD